MIENEMLEQARQKVALGNYGVEIRFVQIRTIELPKDVSQAVFDRMKAERAKLVSVITADAQERSSNIRSEADSQASKLLAEAEAKALEIRGQGEQAMIQSLQVMSQNPELAKLLMNLNMLEELSKDKTTWILDHTTTGLGVLQAEKPPGANAAAPAK